MKVVHVSPHPDDEAIGAPATLRALKNAGHEVADVLLTLGSNEKLKESRLKEATRAHQAAGIELIFSKESSLPKADIYLSPSLWDAHPRHEKAALWLRDALPEGAAWWQWNLWGELPRPSLIYYFGKEELQEAQGNLSFYRSQIARNDFLGLLASRARLSSIRGREQVEGWGRGGKREPYAEIFLEARRVGGQWMRGKARSLDPKNPLLEPSEDSLESLFGRSLL